MFALLIIFVLISGTVDAQKVEGSASTRSRAQKLSQARIFDLPKYAPTARIIRLSTTIGRKKQMNDVDKSLLRDAAGSFDNFDAFDLEELEASSSSETTSPRPRTKERHSSEEEKIGDFFPESS